tara:strand:+ start:703 stop:885 length:183 start_codon:yes stop_codon:yes gene_type:complete
MEKNEIQKLVDIRSDLLSFYNALDAKNEPTAVIKQASVALEVETVIKKIDAVLKHYVNFS